VLFITHDLALMVQVSDRIGIMLEGELVEVDEAQAIYRAPQHEYTRRLWASIPRLTGERTARDAIP
jgi:peptide/nickel transport system ATP-binding protein